MCRVGEPCFHRPAPVTCAARGAQAALCHGSVRGKGSPARHQEHFDVYLKLSPNARVQQRLRARTGSTPYHSKAIKHFSRFGILRPNIPLCQQRFVRAIKSGRLRCRLLFGSLTALLGPLCKHDSAVRV